MKKTEKIYKFEKPAYKSPKTYIRPNSMTILEAPSRIANTLFYPDGTTKHENATSKESA